MSLVLNGTTGITNLPSINSGQIGGSRNKIINGAMVIDQRNVGASVTPASTPTYTIDRWNFQYTANSKFSTQRSTTVPSGFTNSMLVTSLSAYSVGSGDIFLVQQSIEGFNIADLAWGTASATTVTLSLWVRSSLTGTFGGALLNAAQNRSYPFTYAISSANTWEKKSITIAGDTTGTWATDNSAGIRVTFGLGGGATYSGTAGEWVAAGKYTATSAVSVVGTNAATWHVTGVQLEVGSTATEFESRSFGEELALCKRYFEKSYDYDVVPGTNTIVGTHASGGNNAGTTTSWVAVNSYIFATAKRDNPTMVAYDTAGTAGKITRFHYGAADVHGQNPVFNAIGTTNFDGYSSGTGGSAAESGTRLHFTATSEL
jgi:hypothetical protein